MLLALLHMLALAGSPTETSTTTSDPSPAVDDAPAAEEGEPDTQPEPIKPDSPDEDDFGAVLANAKKAYFSGSHSEALDLLRDLQIRLLMGENVDEKEAAEALIYLGEIHFTLGQDSEAQAAFRWVLERDPETEISPYHHPMDVIGLFELVRRTVREEAGEPPEPPRIAEEPIPRLPVWGYLPLGVPQFAQRRTGAGVLHASIQTGLGIASLATFAHLQTINVDERGHPLDWNRQEIAERVRARRYYMQWPLTVGFYGAWAVSLADAQTHWRRSHRPQVALQPITRGSGMGVAVRGRF